MNRFVQRRWVTLIALAFSAACGNEPNLMGPAASAAPSASNPVPAASIAEVRPRLQRKTTPADKRKSDETACSNGNIDACRAMADRYRAYGHPAGCGVERSGHSRSVRLPDGSTLQVRIKRMSEDWLVDEEAFSNWIGKACDLGNAESCTLDRGFQLNFRAVREKPAADMALRSSLDSSALLAWKKVRDPKVYAELVQRRESCPKESYRCAQDSYKFYRREVQRAPSELEAATKDLAESIITKTLDARTALMMLDKNGYTSEMVAPVRTHAAKVLLEACLEGSCVCGDAAHFVPADDARRVDLARLGCENGEAEGCYEFGRMLEEGQGIAKDERAARVFYEIACPPYRPIDYGDEPKTSDYSPAACDRLAEIYEGGAMPPKDLARAQYYAEFACKYPGMEHEHAPCIRLGRYWTSRALRTNCRDAWCAGDLAQALEKFNGPSNPPAEPKECERPSVKALCEKYKGELEEMKKPPKP